MKNETAYEGREPQNILREPQIWAQTEEEVAHRTGEWVRPDNESGV